MATFLLMLHHFPLSNQITYNFLKKASFYELADKIRSTSWGHMGQRSLHTSGTGSKSLSGYLRSRCSRGLNVVHCVCARMRNTQNAYFRRLSARHYSGPVTGSSLTADYRVQHLVTFPIGGHVNVLHDYKKT